ncbi:Arachidonate 12-lipoxygenase, 12R-type [Nymphon striatum]|nr:Arachidonate 12-lipoxygenase, 12R-type [Nymphon striatum]
MAPYTRVNITIRSLFVIVVLLQSFIALSSALECGVTIENAPFTDCNDTYWAGVTFYFGETEISKPMSEVCQHGAVSFKIQVANDQFVQDGRFELILRDISSHYKPQNNQWFIDTVSVSCPSQATSMKIGVGRQLDSGRLYTFLDYDTFTNIPGYMMDQQTQEIANARVDYQETAALGTGPLLIERLTKEDWFTFMTVISAKKRFMLPSIIALRTKVASLTSEEVKFKSLDEVVHFFDGSFPAYPKEEGIPYWDKDEWFASQRLQGTSPGLITMVKSLDPDFKIDEERVSKLTGKSLNNLIKQRRLFMPNLDLLKEFPQEIWTPMALFYIDDNEKLLPLAIQLQRDVNAADVFYSDDPKYSWILAKMFYNCAESVHHQMAVHLGTNHLFMDMAAITLLREVSPSHPVYKLMKPHFFGMFGNNICKHHRALIDTESVKINGESIKTIRYADDTAVVATSQLELQKMISRSHEMCTKYGMSINIKKTIVMVVRKKKEQHTQGIKITVDGQKLEHVKEYTYLGSVVKENAKCLTEVRKRIGMAKTSFWKCKEFLRRDLALTLKKRLLDCYVKSVAAYGCEAWTFSKEIIARINALQLWCYRRMLKVKYTDHITNKKVKELFGAENIQWAEDLARRKLKFEGHVMRGCCDTLTQLVLEGLVEGKRDSGRQRKVWGDDLKEWTKSKNLGEVKRKAENKVVYGVKALMSNGAVADSLLTGTSALGLKLLSASLRNVDFKKINPLLDTKDRMVDDIPTYPFRDRSNDIYGAIWEYVDGIVNNYYQNDEQVQNDLELIAFRKMLAMNPKYQGMGWKSLPGSDKTGRMTLHQLVDILATMLYQATAGHASINNNIYDSVSLLPNYPLKLKIPPIKPSDHVTEQTIIDSLPNKVEAVFIAEQAAGLSFDYGNELGYPHRPLLFSPKDQKVIKSQELQLMVEELRTASSKVGLEINLICNRGVAAVLHCSEILCDIKDMYIFILICSSAMECGVTIANAPFTDCNDTYWSGVTFYFGETEISKPMSEVCQRGAVTFKVQVANDLFVQEGRFEMILRDVSSHYKPRNSQWFIDTVSVGCPSQATSMKIGVGRQIDSGRLYTFLDYDTLTNTPEYMMDQQRQEITNSRVNYQETEALGYGPLVIKKISKEDAFTFKAVINDRNKRLKPSIIALRTKLAKLTSEEAKFKSLDEMVHFFDGSTPEFHKQQGIPYWDQDEWFASQRLQGSNPGVITMVKRLDPDFKINKERVEKITGKSLYKLIWQRRLYISNLDILKEFPEDIWAPMALFYIDENETLLPLAIQLQRNANASDVFYSDDPKLSWIFAKMFYNCAEAVHHQMVTHLGRSHLLIDKAAIALLREVSPSHPVYKLMKPHFFGMFANNMRLSLIFWEAQLKHLITVVLNLIWLTSYKVRISQIVHIMMVSWLGVAILLKPGTVTDRVLQGTSVLGMKLLSAGLHNVNFRKINPLLDTEDRMVDDIPTYPFRDRSNDIYGVLREYVDGIMSNYYQNNEQVKNDVELRSFRKMMAMSPKYQGAGWKNLPGSDKTGKMKFHHLVDILSTMLYQATAGHAAVNNNIYDSFSLIPNYPLKLKSSPIKPSDNVSEQTIIDSLPNKLEAAYIAEQAAGLSIDYGNELGYPERPLLFSPKDQKVIERYLKGEGDEEVVVSDPRFQPLITTALILHFGYLKGEGDEEVVVLDPRFQPLITTALILHFGYLKGEGDEEVTTALILHFGYLKGEGDEEVVVSDPRFQPLITTALILHFGYLKGEGDEEVVVSDPRFQPLIVFCYGKQRILENGEGDEEVVVLDPRFQPLIVFCYGKQRILENGYIYRLYHVYQFNNLTDNSINTSFWISERRRFRESLKTLKTKQYKETAYPYPWLDIDSIKNSMHFIVVVLLQSFIALSSAMECGVTIANAPFTDCNDTYWSGVTFYFGETEISKPMSEVCQRGAVTFNVQVANDKFVQEGRFKMILRDISSHYKPENNQWFIDTVSVRCPSQATSMKIGVGRQLDSGRLYTFLDYDTLTNIPEYMIDQHRQELANSRVNYQETAFVGSGPLVIKKLTKEDLFTFMTVVNEKRKFLLPSKVALRTKLANLTSEEAKFKSLDEMVHFFDGSIPEYPEEQGIPYWDQDEWFASQRLQGSSPGLITMVKILDPDFKIDKERVEKITGKSLNNLIQQRRLYMPNLDILKEFPEDIWAPMALFYIDENETLLPLAIQLQRDVNASDFGSTGEAHAELFMDCSDFENRATSSAFFTSDDPKLSWILAKMFYNCAEAVHHQVVVHFGNNHMLMDMAAITLLREVSPSHPVYKLMKPHFFGMFGNNMFGIIILMGTGGVLDRVMTGTSVLGMKLLSASLRNVDFRKINPLLDTKDRMVDDIPTYPFRDRSNDIYGAIWEYVNGIMGNYYQNNKQVQNDVELRSFRKMLGMNPKYQGMGWKNLPGSDKTGKMKFDHLVDILSTMLYQATAGHAAVNNNVYDSVSLVPNFPVKLKMSPIKPSHPLEAEQSAGLRFDYGNELGYSERPLLFSPKDQKVIERFRESLETLKTKQYNETAYPYRWLDIHTIKNSMIV